MGLLREKTHGSNHSRNERVDLPAKRPLREKWNSRNALRERNRSRNERVDLPAKRPLREKWNSRKAYVNETVHVVSV